MKYKKHNWKEIEDDVLNSNLKMAEVARWHDVNPSLLRKHMMLKRRKEIAQEAQKEKTDG